MMKFRAVIVATMLTLSATTALAQDAGIPEEGTIDPVVAIINGEVVRASEVVYLYESLGPEVTRFAFATVYSQLLENTIERKLMAVRARAEGLLEDPEVVARVEFWVERVLEEILVNRSVESSLTDEMIDAAYQQMLADTNIVDEVRASHILVETQAEAYEAIARLSAGELFADLARELSTGPSGANGGDLDFFQYEAVIPEFSEVAFSLAVGEYTTEPVETSFGWHVILVTDRRAVEPPTFDEMFAELRQQEGVRLVGELYKEVLDGADIQRFNFDGTPAGQQGPVMNEVVPIDDSVPASSGD